MQIFLNLVVKNILNSLINYVKYGKIKKLIGSAYMEDFVFDQDV